MIALSVLLVLSAAGADASGAAKEPGDLWEVTSTMSMEGMPMEMPSTTVKVCTSKDWTEPPGANAGKNCETIEFAHSDTGATWKLRCAGPPAMTGEGEITRTGPDAYKGTIKITSDEANLTMTLDGRRLGDCDRDAKP